MATAISKEAFIQACNSKKRQEELQRQREREEQRRREQREAERQREAGLRREREQRESSRNQISLPSGGIDIDIPTFDLGGGIRGNMF